MLTIASCINPKQSKNKPQIIQAMSDTIALEFKDTPQLNIDNFLQLKKTKAKKYVLIDTRSLKERKISILPGAISLEQFNKERGRYQGFQVILYCTIGLRSSKTAYKLREQGINAFNLEKGILGWAQKQLPFYGPNNKRTYIVHVYGKQWDLLPKNYQGVTD